MMVRRILWTTVCLFCISFVAVGAAKKKGDRGSRTKTDPNPRTELAAAATPAKNIHVPEGFKVELLYSVPKEQEGSWVNICVDPKGRLIVSDQYGSLYRIAPPAIGSSDKPKVERIPVEIGMAHGLLWAFDSLYVMVNSPNREKNGLYRVTDKDGDGELDTVTFLKHLDGEGEHGPHAVIPAPDGKSLYVVCGDNTKPVEDAESRVPKIWDEDQLLPRIYGVSFMRGVPAPGGFIYHLDPDGKKWELVTSGFRNPFDIAFNADGELFTYDADMEWDIGAPWYRPTRVCHAVSGADWGWRNGSAKWPEYWDDTLPPAANIGLGSPTGITFGYGAKFPAKYQNVLFMCDWTYGKMYAVQLTPEGASYRGAPEEFMTATPLPLTDMLINPHDGAMYFLIGGRKTQSGLYRLTYAGKESTAPAVDHQANQDQRDLRHKLEALHVGDHPEAVEVAWPQLSNSDRFIRYAARTALEHRPLEGWQDRALAEKDPQASLTALLGVVRMVPRSFKPTGADLDTPPPTYPADNAMRHPLEQPVLAALARLDWDKLSVEQRLELLRVYELALYRLGAPDEATRNTLIARLDKWYPADDRRCNVMLTQLMSYLQAPSAAKKGVELLLAAPTQQEQIDVARSLQYLNAGWTLDVHRQFFEWLAKAQGFHGGNNFPIFDQELRTNALVNTTAEERKELGELLVAKPKSDEHGMAATNRPFVKDWKMDDVVPLLAAKLKDRNFEHGRQMFAAANCYGCHHFAGEGGNVGPDLTGLAGRFSPRDILESVLEPSKVISDQYAASIITTSNGKVFEGRITNYNGDGITINTNMLDPNATVTVNRNDVESMEPSKVSPMPVGLLNTLQEDDLLDLMAFLLSRGDSHNKMFTEKSASASGGQSPSGGVKSPQGN
ncbi:MAG TPA: c-type cytochrome [Lacipirellulaceae bacterium]|jgi:putative heme-binding domain-containing protein|nr:c-type cytochrome [Lacipirellulaceae bacterium]